MLKIIFLGFLSICLSTSVVIGESPTVPAPIIRQVEAIRLVGGPNDAAGRVEILSQGVWGTLCDDLFSNNGAKVICRSLGYQSGTGFVARHPWIYGSAATSMPILLDDVQCFGNETSLNDCEHPPIGEHDCGHAEDVAVICGLGEIEGIRLVGGQNERVGRLEVLSNGFWGTVCDDMFDRNADRVACQHLGFPTDAPIRLHSGRMPANDTSLILLDNVFCLGNETTLNDCNHLPLGEHDCGHEEDVSLACSESPPEYVTQVRLVNGSSPNEGRVEVLVNGTWGTICDDWFNDENAQVICRMLGYPNNVGQAFGMAHFGAGSGTIHLDEVNCRGDEQSLNFCMFAIQHDCNPIEDAGVRCG